MLKQIKESKVVDWIGIHKDELIMSAFVVGITSVSWIVSAKMEDFKINRGTQNLYDKGYLRFFKPSDNGEFIETTTKELSAWLTNNK